MRALFGVRVQTAVVILLFLASLATLLLTSFSAFLVPRREERIRETVRAAALHLARAAEAIVAADRPLAPDLHPDLAGLTAENLADFSGVEGGFFLGDVNRFLGFGFPTDPHPPPNHGRKDRRDPPPREKPYIETQVHECLTRPRGLPPMVQSYNVGPASRVVVATEPVGPARPARLAVWVMTRLNGLESQQDEAHRYQLAVGLALGGVLLALVLTANLGRTLRRERDQRERLREDLRRAEHLATLGRLLAGVAHEVRNPLAGIRSTVQLWQRLPEVARDPASLEAVLRAAGRLDDLVSRLLYFVRGGHEERRPVDLNAVVGEALDLLRARATDQGVTVQVDLAPSLPQVAGSGQALQQVVLNLITNALQAMPEGGRLRCRTHFRAAGNRVELLVSDTGPGVPPTVRSHLFEPFFTTRADGAGLGLALCREIVLQHGGGIELAEAGPGAVFRVWLPPATPGRELST